VSVTVNFGTSVDMSGQFGIGVSSALVPKCLGSEVSWGDTLRLLGAIEIHCNHAVYVSLNTNANPNPNPNPKLSPNSNPNPK